jgi:lipooligosaccharide transport system permease protein
MTQVTPPPTAAEFGLGARMPRFRFWLVTERKIRALRGYWSSALITSFGNPIVYLLALGIGLGSLVPTGVDGVDYLVFVAPALLAMAAVFVANEESTYPILVGFKYRPIFIAMHQTSLRGRDILVGQMVFIALRMVVTVGIYFFVIWVFGGVVLPTAPLAILVATMTGLAVAAPISAYAATITVDRGQLPMLFRLVFMPLFLFSGTFFPLETLPTGLQIIGWVSPLWHGAEWGRVLTYGLAEPWWLTLIHFLYLAVWIVVGIVLGLRVFDRRLEGN